VAAGWTTEGACAVLEVDRRRVWRWQCRRDTGVGLDDRASGGNAIHGLLGWEIDEILALAEEWGPIDRSHRKLAHRGSDLKRVWVAPSTVRRVLASHDVDLPAAVPQPTRPERKPWPDWVEYRPRQGLRRHPFRCRVAPNCVAIIDLVSRKWIATLLSPEETAIQTQVVFLQALEAEELIGTVENRLDTGELPAGDRGHETDGSDQGLDDLDGQRLGGEHLAHGQARLAQQQQRGQRRRGVGEHQGVDGRGDVVPTDADPCRVELAGTEAGSAVMQFPDGGYLGDVMSSGTPSVPMILAASSRPRKLNSGANANRLRDSSVPRPFCTGLLTPPPSPLYTIPGSPLRRTRNEHQRRDHRSTSVRPHETVPHISRCPWSSSCERRR
jgi:hypothetical protein